MENMENLENMKNLEKYKMYETGFITPNLDDLRTKQGLSSQVIANYCMVANTCSCETLYPAKVVKWNYNAEFKPKGYY